jgi:hypothetical protein
VVVDATDRVSQLLQRMDGNHPRQGLDEQTRTCYSTLFGFCLLLRKMWSAKRHVLLDAGAPGRRGAGATGSGTGPRAREDERT